jgi:hypothetical protein
MKDYAKIKAMAQSILQCIGDDEEGEDPAKPVRKQKIDNPKSFGTQKAGPQEYESQGEQEPLLDFTPAGKDGLTTEGDRSNAEEEGKRKKRKDDVVALLTSTLASKFNK